MRSESERIALLQPDDRVEGFAKSRSVLGDGIKDRLHIGRRAGDHTQDLARRGLLLERLRERDVARLHFIEQAHVFDCDHRLVGEGLEQVLLRSWNRPRFGPADDDDAERLALAQHRHPEHSPPAHG